jgi:hypothetical protein
MVIASLAYLWQHLPDEDRRISKLYDLYHTKDTTYSIAVLLDTITGMNKTAYDCWAAYLELPDRDEAGQLGRTETLSRPPSWCANTASASGRSGRTLIDNAGMIKCFGMRNSRMAQEIAAPIGGIRRSGWWEWTKTNRRSRSMGGAEQMTLYRAAIIG